MSAIRSKNTKPELVVRRFLHARGLRFRLHRKDLPGKPDLVLPKYQTVIFVDGCFWHGHNCARSPKGPATNVSYWKPKIVRTRERDKDANAALRHDGWTVIRIWECELSDVRLEQLEAEIRHVTEPYS
jgi:DNA mismatch endonuclease (patch repair protein)